MKTAKEHLNDFGLSENCEDNIIEIINAARKEAIEECAKRAHAYRGDVDKQSILKLIDELK
jgi:uncharacterized protein YdbL (DUF1318 family)